MTEEVVQQELEKSEVEEEMTYESLYREMKILVDSLESDVLKSCKGNRAAGVRLRKSLRLLKEKSGNFVKFTLGKL
tara:strand:+ start:321 stop:548 length:228 start_codon:yes stop_codon:yes gene_type:complete